jgi:hypothetical protein
VAKSRVIGRILLLAFAVCASNLGWSDASDSPGAALTQLRGLAGEWEGSDVWSGARVATGTMNATYKKPAMGLNSDHITLTFLFAAG